MIGTPQLAKHQAEHKKHGEHTRQRPEPEGRRPSPSLAARFEKPHGRAIPRFEEIQSESRLVRLVLRSAVHTAGMTIPDVGRCLGSGEPPREGTEAADRGVSTGLCVACSGRFEIHHGRLVDHESAPVEDRESVQT